MPTIAQLHMLAACERNVKNDEKLKESQQEII